MSMHLAMGYPQTAIPRTAYFRKLSLIPSVIERRLRVELGLSRMTQSGHVRSVTVAGPITAFARKVDVAIKTGR